MRYLSPKAGSFKYGLSYSCEPCGEAQVVEFRKLPPSSTAFFPHPALPPRIAIPESLSEASGMPPSPMQHMNCSGCRKALY